MDDETIRLRLIGSIEKDINDLLWILENHEHKFDRENLEEIENNTNRAVKIALKRLSFDIL